MIPSHRSPFSGTAATFAAAIVLLLGSCAGTSTSKDSGAAAKGEDKEHELALAELALQKARLEGEKSQASSQLAVHVAEKKLEEAQRAMKVFRERQKSLKQEELQLSHDRAAGRADDAAVELAELEAMYAEEEFALTTKELVLTRGRRGVEHSQRAVNLAQRKLQNLMKAELPQEERKLERAIVEAEGKLEDARAGLEVAELSGRIAVDKAEHKLMELKKGKDKS